MHADQQSNSSTDRLRSERQNQNVNFQTNANEWHLGVKKNKISTSLAITEMKENVIVICQISKDLKNSDIYSLWRKTRDHKDFTHGWQKWSSNGKTV